LLIRVGGGEIGIEASSVDAACFLIVERGVCACIYGRRGARNAGMDVRRAMETAGRLVQPPTPV
jgi:hypothetical protein